MMSHIAIARVSNGPRNGFDEVMWKEFDRVINLLEENTPVSSF